jgi:prevent-host-death family protein
MNIVTLTSAKARFSELINRLIYQKAMITITKRGRNVAVLLPWEAYQEMVRRQKGRLLDAAGCLSDYIRIGRGQSYSLRTILKGELA